MGLITNGFLNQGGANYSFSNTTITSSEISLASALAISKTKTVSVAQSGLESIELGYSKENSVDASVIVSVEVGLATKAGVEGSLSASQTNSTEYAKINQSASSKEISKEITELITKEYSVKTINETASEMKFSINLENYEQDYFYAFGLFGKIGVYQVIFQVNVNEAGQLIITLNGEEVTSSVVGRAMGTSQIIGMSIIQTNTENSVLTVRNPAGSAAALTITPLAGGVRSVSAHLITQLA